MGRSSTRERNERLHNLYFLIAIVVAAAQLNRIISRFVDVNQLESDNFLVRMPTIHLIRGSATLSKASPALCSLLGEPKGVRT
jgi:hypothetical protein